MDNTASNFSIEEVKRTTSQTNAIIKWVCGIISATFIIMMGWMWNMNNMVNVLQRSIDKEQMTTERQSGDITHLRNHADQAETTTASLRQVVSDLDRRTASLEGQSAQGARFTAKDGELMAERIRINGDRITVLEQWRLREEEEHKRKTSK